MTEHGGTVRYHDAVLDKLPRDKPWAVQFVEGGRWLPFTAAEGEAMGLTPPEPAPLVVECNGRQREIDRPDAQAWVNYWERQPVDGQFRRVGQAVAGLLWHALRDARQDPQPASDTVSGHVEPMDDPYKRQPERGDTASDTIDFDALPTGTVAEGMVIREARQWNPDGNSAWSRMVRLIGDAAREARNG